MYTTDAVLLSVRESGEHDLFASFFTRDFGKVTAKVRGARKHTTKQGNFLHSFARARISFILGKGGALMAGVTSEYEYPAISQNLIASGYTTSFLSLCDKLIYEYASDEKLWGAIEAVLVSAESIASSSADERQKREALWKEEKMWIIGLLEVLGLGTSDVRLEGARDKAHLDQYLHAALQSKCNTPVSFFGMKMGVLL
ncbi:MAG: recombination protein O N-terminal domain-containing protein [Candidatus Spechtbacterales bacterium]